MDVVPVSPERLDIAAGVLGRAFADDPMVRWTLGGDPSAPIPVDRCIDYVHTINVSNTEAGVLWRTSDDAGAAVWLPPAMTATFAEDEMSERPLVAPSTADGGARSAMFWDWLNAHIPDEPAWYLDQLGVDPSRQGSGAGIALVRHGLAMADAAGEPAFLETGTARNVPYYERFGFRVLAEGDAPGGGPHVWFMRRERAA